MDINLQNQYNRIKTNIENVYTKIGEKEGTIPTEKKSENLAESISTIKTGIDINGIIKEYQIMAGEDISAGDFVKYINGSNNMTDNLLNEAYVIGTYDKTAVLLTENKVLLSYGFSDLYVVVINITNDNQFSILGTPTEIGTPINYGHPIVKLTDNTVFIMCQDNGGIYKIENNGNVSIISSTYSFGAETGPSTIEYFSDVHKILYVYGNGSSYYIYLGIITITDTTTYTTFTCSSTIIDNGTKNGWTTPSLLKISNNRAICLFCQGTGWSYLYGKIITTSGSYGTTVQLNTTYSIPGQGCLITDTTAFYAYPGQRTNSADYLNGMILSFNSTGTSSLSVSYTTQIKENDSYSGKSIGTPILLNDNKIFLTYPNSSNYYLTALLLNNTSNTISIAQELTLSSVAKSSYSNSVLHTQSTVNIKINQETDTILCFHHQNSSSDNGANILLYTINPKKGIGLYTGTTITGLAAESGSAGDTIEVYVPNV